MSESAQAAACTVRLCDPSDREFVLALAARFGPTRASWRNDTEVVSGTQRHLAEAFDRPRAGEAILIALDTVGRPSGFAWIVTHEDFFSGEPHAHISEIATVIDGRGFGSALLHAAETMSRERGFRYVSLNVNDANTEARRFYTARSYVPEYRHLVKLL